MLSKMPIKIRTVPISKYRISDIGTLIIRVENVSPRKLFQKSLILWNESNGAKQNIQRVIEKVKQAAQYKRVDAYYFFNIHYFEGTDGFAINLKDFCKYIKFAVDEIIHLHFSYLLIKINSYLRYNNK